MTNDEMLHAAASASAQLLLEADLPEKPTTAMMILHTQRAINAGIFIGLQQAEDIITFSEKVLYFPNEATT